MGVLRLADQCPRSFVQLERKIEIDPGTTIKSELLASQMRASGPGYVDMVHRSGANIDWLVEHSAFGGFRY